MFHSMASQVPARVGSLVWTTCDKANVTLVHDVATHSRIATIPLPRKVATLGGVPHDTTSNDRYGYVSYIKNSDGAGYVGVYDIVKFKLVRLVKTAADPHVGLLADSGVVVAAQGGTVGAYSQGLRRLRRIDDNQPSPHGVAVSMSGRKAYVTNIAGKGEKAIVTYALRRRTSRGEAKEWAPQKGCPPIRTSKAIPHNLSITSDDRVLLVTYSGAESSVVGLWEVGRDGCVLAGTERLVKTGKNPFGVCFLRKVTPPRRG